MTAQDAITETPRSDNNAYRFPVSIKGVILINNQVLLLKNERDEWELPGGKLELAESPEQCLLREIDEELAIKVSVGKLLDSWLYHIKTNVEVLIITFGCHAESTALSKCSSEHKAAKLFDLSEVAALPMPQGYKTSIATWAGIITG